MWLSGVVGLSLIHDHYLFLVRTGFINRSVLLTNILHQLHYRIISLLQLKETEAKLFAFKIDNCGLGYQVIEVCTLAALNQ